MTRRHDHALELIAELQPPAAPAGPAAPDGPAGIERWLLLSPAPGWFRPAVAPRAWCPARTEIGTLDVLGRRHALVLPQRIGGYLLDELPSGAGSLVAGMAPRAVQFREPLALLGDAHLVTGAARSAAATTGAAEPSAGAAQLATRPDGLVFCAPTSGRFYSRPTADKPPFVTEGAALTVGTTICLLEVMKTFHRVHYGGPGLPDTARVRRVLVADGADVNAGDPLLALE
ncbi:MAG: hypothetical protein E6J90_09365 [Deltaproteobacteria bacterium]|nr:MAG: hypothetical protein E6J91_09095 [Deltaproteobacteria bacterium]TMQ23997.1 MAG: hypothetical protein E6J90_09365 [Deltaproteobacteria bacterium]